MSIDSEYAKVKKKLALAEVEIQELYGELDSYYDNLARTAVGFWANVKLYFVRLGYAFANKPY